MPSLATMEIELNFPCAIISNTTDNISNLSFGRKQHSRPYVHSLFVRLLLLLLFLVCAFVTETMKRIESTKWNGEKDNGKMLWCTYVICAGQCAAIQKIPIQISFDGVCCSAGGRWSWIRWEFTFVAQN